MPMALIPQEAALNLARAIRPSICQNCLRAFTSTARRQSGHNKWSKIRHDKAANDAKKTNKRTEVTRALTVCSRRASIARF